MNAVTGSVATVFHAIRAALPFTSRTPDSPRPHRYSPVTVRIAACTVVGLMLAGLQTVGLTSGHYPWTNCRGSDTVSAAALQGTREVTNTWGPIAGNVRTITHLDPDGKLLTQARLNGDTGALEVRDSAGRSARMTLNRGAEPGWTNGGLHARRVQDTLVPQWVVGPDASPTFVTVADNGHSVYVRQGDGVHERFTDSRVGDAEIAASFITLGGQEYPGGHASLLTGVDEAGRNARFAEALPCSGYGNLGHLVQKGYA